MSMIYASPDKPFLLCMTCRCATNKAMRRTSVTLRDEKRKTWKRLIKPNSNGVTTEYRGKPTKVKEIIYSILLQDCLIKKHVLSIRKKPFARALVQELI